MTINLSILISIINQIRINEFDLNLNRILRVFRKNAKVSKRGEIRGNKFNYLGVIHISKFTV